MDDDDGPGEPPERAGKTQEELLAELKGLMLSGEFEERVRRGEVILQDHKKGVPTVSHAESPEEKLHREVRELIDQPRVLWLHSNENLMKPDGQGNYDEGDQYTEEKDLHGGTSGATVSVIRDKATKQLLVKKETEFDETVLDAMESTIRAMGQLQAGSSSFPKLMLVKRSDDRIAMYMELVSDGVPLSTVCDHIKQLDQAGLVSPEWTRQFALCVMHQMLSVLKYMNDSGWAHGDFTAGNILLRISRMELAVIDLALVEKIIPDVRQNLETGAEGDISVEGQISVDYHDAYILFCTLYTAGHFTDITHLEEELARRRSPRLAEGYRILTKMSGEERQGMQTLLRCCQDIVQNQQQRRVHVTSQTVLWHIEDILFPEMRGEVAFRCFLRALDDFSLQEVAEDLRNLLTGEKGEQHSPEAALDKRRKELLQALGSAETCYRICQRLEMWSVLCGTDQDNESDSPGDQLLRRIHQAVTSRQPYHRICGRLPSDVRKSIDQDLHKQERMRVIMEKLREYLTPSGELQMHGDRDTVENTDRGSPAVREGPQQVHPQPSESIPPATPSASFASAPSASFASAQSASFASAQSASGAVATAKSDDSACNSTMQREGALVRPQDRAESELNMGVRNNR